MENTKLISLLRSFTPDELKEFQKFIDSPFYNNEKSVSNFYEILKKCAPEYNMKNIQREKIYKKLYPEKSFNDVVMRNIISRTLKLAEEYVTIKEFSETEDLKSLMKMKALSNRDQVYLFEKARKEAEHIIESNPYRDEGYFYSRMVYEDELVRYSKRLKSVVFVENENLQ